MSIVNLKGERITPEPKRAHDPERVNTMRAQLNNVMIGMQRGWAGDMQHDPTGATQPNVQAIREHWGRKWQDQAVAVLNSSEPVDVNPLALFEWIDKELAAKQRRDQNQLPLHSEDLDLEQHGFKLLGMVHAEPVWVGTEAVLHLRSGGGVRVYPRQQYQSVQQHVRGAAITVDQLEPLVSLPDYTLGELESLLATLRRERNALPAEEDMNAAREVLQNLVKP